MSVIGDRFNSIKHATNQQDIIDALTEDPSAMIQEEIRTLAMFNDPGKDPHGREAVIKRTMGGIKKKGYPSIELYQVGTDELASVILTAVKARPISTIVAIGFSWGKYADAFKINDRATTDVSTLYMKRIEEVVYRLAQIAASRRTNNGQTIVGFDFYIAKDVDRPGTQRSFLDLYARKDALDPIKDNVEDVRCFDPCVNLTYRRL